MSNEKIDYFFSVLNFSLDRGTEPMEALRQTAESYAHVYCDWVTRYLGNVQVSESLAVETHSGTCPGVSIARAQGGLVFVRAAEIRHLVEALCTAAGMLAAEAKAD